MIVPVRTRPRKSWGWSLLILALGWRLSAQVTETPYTMAPGKFLLEMDALTVGVNRDTSQPNTFTALGLASAILSTGLTRDLDLQVGLQFFMRQTYQYRGARSSSSGRGDMTVRAKWTFWRDAGSGAAAAVIPYVKIPSNTGGVGNNHLEGGFIVPWGLALGRGTNFGAMAQWDVVRDSGNTGYDSRWFVSGFAHQHIAGPFGMYAETTLSVSSASASTFKGGLGGGATWRASSALLLDYGISRGLGAQATDWINVVRVTWAF